MGERSSEIKPIWLHPDKLTGLIDMLREDGYNIGVSQYVAAQKLVLALIANGQDLSQPERFKRFLGPLLCSSPIEQEDFSLRFDHWINQITALPTAQLPETDKIKGAQADRKSFSRPPQRAILVGLVGVLFIVIVGVLINLGADITQAAQSWSGVLSLLFLALTIFLTWTFWRIYRANLFLIRATTNLQPDEINTISVKSLQGNLFAPSSIARVASNLRHRVDVPHYKVDINRTIKQTIKNAGWFAPAYTYHRSTPEYLILVDRASHRDHQAEYAKELINQLREQDVLVKVYYFRADPRICFPESGRSSPVPLAEVAKKFGFHRLILFSDGGGLFNMSTGEYEPWIDLFTTWDKPILVTPVPYETWGYQEQQLAQQFTMAPSSLEDLTTVIQSHQQPVQFSTSKDEFPYPLPDGLQTRPRRWLERDPVEPLLVKRMLDLLRYYLGPAGYLWLSACAVYPAILWGLTLYLGNAIRTEGGDKLLQPRNLLKLARLPWFRYGYMPDWFREQLINELSPDQEKQIRSALEELLVSTSLAGDPGNLQLEIAQRHHKFLPLLNKPLLSFLLRKTEPNNPIRDYVFLNFVASQKHQKLGVLLPDVLRHLAEFDQAQDEPSPSGIRVFQLLKRLYNYLVPKVKIITEIDNVPVIIWRRHPMILILKIFLPYTSIMVLSYLLLAIFFPGKLFPFNSVTIIPAFFIQLPLVILLNAAVIWYLWRYDGWIRDRYILTDKQVIAIESSPFHLFGSMQREVSFEHIQSITFNISNWPNWLINMGNVIIQTEGVSSLILKNVFNPEKVFENIMYRHDAYMLLVRKKESTQQPTAIDLADVQRSVEKQV